MDLLATLKPYLVIGVRLYLTVLLWRLYFISQRGKANLNSHQKCLLLMHTYILVASFLSKKKFRHNNKGGCHLHLLVFAFVYQFNSRIVALVYLQMTSSEGFQHHFKKICCDCYIKKTLAFTLISFAVLKWDNCLLV